MSYAKKMFFSAAFGLLSNVAIQAQQGWTMQSIPIQSRWARDVSPTNALPEYPRPQLVRSGWINLNGLWQYAITKKDADQPVSFDGQILVPYPLESALSGVKKALLPNENLWYKTSFDKPALKTGEKLLLHFGAVDWRATVFVNGKLVGSHQGGYTAFTLDVTSALHDGKNELVVKVFDPTDQGIGPHGKQVLNPQNIYYTATSGIWQTVWLEAVPAVYITDIKLTPDIDKGVLNVEVNAPGGAGVELMATEGGRVVSRKTGKAGVVISLPIAKAHLWSPADAFLYDLQVKLVKGGKALDEVKSYFGMRKISIGKDEKGFDRICLNNQPYYNLGTLDQGFWPDGLYTAPTDEALSFDIKVIKAEGFNTIRKHIKVEPARWYYYADKLGMLVWQDMVNPNQGLPEGAKAEFEKESAEIVAQLHNNPAITTWVLFNEKWGQYDQERLTKWLKTADPSRIVNGHTGEYLYVNEQLRSPSPNAYVGADITDVHAYPDPMNAIAMPGKARVCGEFGGIGVFIPDHQWITGSAWGYVQEKPASLQAKYAIMVQHLVLMQREGLSGSIYTQPFDVEGEQNGLITYDREVIKIPIDTLRKIHAALNPSMSAAPAVTVTNADLTEPGLVYSRLLQQYIDGDRDPQFLKKLAISASQAGDKPGARTAADEYVGILHAPFSKEDWEYILQVTKSVHDKGFALLKDHAAEVDAAVGPRQAEVKMMNTIFFDVIAASVSAPDANPDWQALSAAVAPYGAPGEEILLRAETFHYINRQDWPHFVAAADEYINKYGANLRPDELNGWAWNVYEKVSDPALLLKAAEWSKLSVKNKEEASFLDTQANLLFKAGKKAEGIAIEEKAVSLSGSAELKANLDKMKATN